MPITDYKELKVWQKAMDLVVEVYKITNILPKYETYGLSDQMRRSAVSIPSNIAEGQGRHSIVEFIRFLNIARGSYSEIDTQLLICKRLGYIQESDIEKALTLSNEVGKMLSALISSLKSTSNK